MLNEMINPKILVIPDIHGRNFWNEAVQKYPQVEIIFLGDYLDPYPNEKISKYLALENFKEILEFAKNNDNCQLLLGNHDMDYILEVEGSRKDIINASYIRSLFLNNIELFDFATIKEINNKINLFSHAPILLEWVKEINETTDAEKLVDKLNLSLINIEKKNIKFLKNINHISTYRGGKHKWGSPIWCDVREVIYNQGSFLSGIDFNIFGHTQLENSIIEENYACLDTRQAYLIDTKGKIIELK